MKKLYIFDFDETLVTCKSFVYVLNKQKERIRQLNSEEYYSYKPAIGEKLDVSDFDFVVKPKIHTNIFELLIKHKDDAIILTARTRKVPVVRFLSSCNINIPVYAIGSNRKPKNLKLVNGKRKAKWIYNISLKEKYDYIEFWDDSVINIQETKKLMSKLPNVNLTCHLTEHKK